MEQYRLFFSWQSDRKDTKKIIKAALKTAKDKLLIDGIDLFVDEDTRELIDGHGLWKMEIECSLL